MATSAAVVIGSGIGGLTAAAALHRSGWQVTVLERAASLEPVGAGISLAPNSQRALDVIGLGDQVRSLAVWQGDGGMRTPSGRWLARTDSAAAAERFGGPLVLLHRAALIGLLRARLPGSAVHTGTPARLVTPGVADGARALVRTPSGDIEADLVIGADGIGSAVRSTLFPGHPGPAYSGFTTWRVISPGVGHTFSSHETWGRGALWGSHPLKDGGIYAYAAAAVPAGVRAADDEKAELLRRYGDWHDPIPGIIASVEPGQVLRHDVHQLADPLPSFHRGRTVLVGDSAHAMVPFLGQGGNQAIEDAVVLAHHVAPEADLGAGLAAYSAARVPRTTAMVRKAAQISRMTRLSAAPAVALRDGLMSAVSRLGPGLVLRTFDGICDWRPPQRTYAARTREGQST
ncbi:FAD-dependent monooxygenase [Streptomyces sp. NBC_01201]|uniref:FAD-dependent monooxygenase n=1 Tax=Streptomyces glycanivorans TaxID=3033808 RepID=A0ABY9JPG8_9ACTN|nr:MULTISPECIES: FAD-dependent monooxygenase [unclassified Streptomyces]TXS10842.1 FAD-binding protein [Streptomyces sp. wa22]WLQ67921.1 FAD-dependent monooxygenase [Streptomyces sp. Alt3]WSR51992.1 FAD-dependent monooxygenase [Streptomyces sp. NBC_01201]